MVVALTLKHFLPFLRGHHMLVRTDNTSTVAHINRQGGLRSRCLLALTRKLLLWSNVHIYIYSEYRGGPPLQGKSPVRGMAFKSMCGRTNLDQVWTCSGGPICVNGERALPALLLPAGSACTSGVGRTCTRVASQAALCIPSSGADLPHSPQSERTSPVTDTDRFALAIHAVACGGETASLRAPVVPPVAQGPTVPSERTDISLSSRETRATSLAPEWLSLTTAGLPQNVVKTIQSARAESTRSLYDCKWRVFEAWCTKEGVFPFNSPLNVVLTFLQDLIDKKRAFSTVKVYLAAISACHVGFDGKTLGQHSLVCRFMKGARRLLPVSTPFLHPGIWLLCYKH